MTAVCHTSSKPAYVAFDDVTGYLRVIWHGRQSGGAFYRVADAVDYRDRCNAEPDWVQMERCQKVAAATEIRSPAWARPALGGRLGGAA